MVDKKKKKTLKRDEAEIENSPSGYAPALNDLFYESKKKENNG